ncbi:MAG: F0F1 ATP synthase subunit delta [Sphingomonadales bacterium]|nr:F0F1 ATP synthase subunit delta [Sphingomonadales bacterium]MDE2168579.1 F0F1 ATP synthase subunit delta [Sphingomonadales bacterium]
MENSAGITASLQGRYASALFDLASETGAVAPVEADLEKLGSALASSEDLTALISNPLFTRDECGRALDSVAGVLELGAVTRKFLGVLAANGRLSALPQVIAAYGAIAASARGEITANVSSAHALGQDQLAALSAKLAAREGVDVGAVKIKASVDPDLLGGLVVRIGSQQIDSSIRTRLNSLAQAMKG